MPMFATLSSMAEEKEALNENQSINPMQYIGFIDIGPSQPSDNKEQPCWIREGRAI